MKIIKKWALSFIYGTAPVGVFWFVYSACGKVANALASLYRRAEYGRNTSDVISKHFSDLVIKNGLFKGMRYPTARAAGSTILPKLLGSYEKELEGIFAGIVQNSYDTIVDVGCAEGYYAVGLALRFPKAKVYAFDTDQEARKLCRDMALANGVGDRVIIGALCDEKTMLALPFIGRTLIIADCEGYEKQLFTPNVVAAIAHHDVLIEVHDLFDMEISKILRKHFKNTHDLTVVESFDELKKVRTYHFPELEPYSTAVRRSILGESRDAIMEWFYFTPRVSIRSQYATPQHIPQYETA